MADLLGCPTCTNVKLPACFDSLVVTLPQAGDYDAVFTNHFGKKKVIAVTTEDDGSLSFDPDDFPQGYFTSFNPVTLEFFLTSEGGYYGNTTDEMCEAVTVCGTAKCYLLEFYEAEDSVEAAIIKCCEDVVPPECDDCETTSGTHRKIITTDDTGLYADDDFKDKEKGVTIRLTQYGDDDMGGLLGINNWAYDSATGTIIAAPNQKYLVEYE